MSTEYILGSFATHLVSTQLLVLLKTLERGKGSNGPRT